MRYILAALAIAFGFPAFAECYNTADVAEGIEGRFGKPHMQGLNGIDNLTELYIAPDGAWAIVVTTPEGLTCDLDSGSVSIIVAPEPKGMDG
jgi:hypothetical protein